MNPEEEKPKVFFFGQAEPPKEDTKEEPMTKLQMVLAVIVNLYWPVVLLGIILWSIFG